MKLTSRDRRALFILLLVVAVIGLRWVTATHSSKPNSTVMAQAAPVGRLLTKLAGRRKATAAISQKEEVLQRLLKELAVQESSLIQGDTAAEAQARLLQILKKATSQQEPPLEVRQIEFSSPRQLGDAYGEVSVSITVQCTIDELLNLISDLT